MLIVTVLAAGLWLGVLAWRMRRSKRKALGHRGAIELELDQQTLQRLREPGKREKRRS